MHEFYVEALTEFMEDDQAAYEVFRSNIEVVPEIFQESVTSTLKVDQLKAVSDEMDYDKVFTRDELDTVAQVYDRLGVIESGTKSFSGTTFYRAPDYHGRGGTKSWDEIVDEVEEACLDAERTVTWQRKRQEEDRGLEEFR